MSDPTYVSPEMPDYTFPEMLARFGPATAPTIELPTESGLYVLHVDRGDEWAAEVYALDTDGFWWRLGHTMCTAEEVIAHAGRHPLERLIRQKDADQ